MAQKTASRIQYVPKMSFSLQCRGFQGLCLRQRRKNTPIEMWCMNLEHNFRFLNTHFRHFAFRVHRVLCEKKQNANISSCLGEDSASFRREKSLKNSNLSLFLNLSQEYKTFSKILIDLLIYNKGLQLRHDSSIHQMKTD